MGLRRQPRSVGRSIGHLVDGPVPRARDRAARRRPHAARRGPERDDQPGAAKASDRPGRPRGVASTSRSRSRDGRTSRLGARSARLLRHACGARCARSIGVSLEIGAGEVLGLVGESGLRQVDARAGHPRAASGGSRVRRRGAVRRPKPRRHDRIASCAGSAGRISGSSSRSR